MHVEIIRQNSFTADLRNECDNKSVIHTDVDRSTMYAQEMETPSVQNDNKSTMSLTYYYYAIAASVGLLVTCLGLVALILCVCIILCKQYQKKFFHTPIESEIEQQDVQCHMSKNIVYEAIIKNNHSHDFMLNDNVAYSSSAANTTTLDYEYMYVM